jgi:hypothetical protein
MITVSSHPKHLFAMHASTTGPVVFLDLFAIKELAKGDPGRRKRFISTLDRGVEVLFSVSNAAELSGPKQSSFSKMRTFLDEIGTHWFPVEFDPMICIKREHQSLDPASCCFSERFLKTYTATRLRRSPEIDKAELPESLPHDFFRLGLFMDWLAPQRDEIIKGKNELDLKLRYQIEKYSAEHRRNPAWLDTKFPESPFTGIHPATFIYVNLIRLLIREAKERAIVENDGIDFCQAVIASAYASVATLDKAWKRRVEMILPRPNKLARIYYGPELDRMVRDIERHLDSLSISRARALCSLN